MKNHLPTWQISHRDEPSRTMDWLGVEGQPEFRNLLIVHPCCPDQRVEEPGDYRVNQTPFGLQVRNAHANCCPPPSCLIAPAPPRSTGWGSFPSLTHRPQLSLKALGCPNLGSVVVVDFLNPSSFHMLQVTGAAPEPQGARAPTWAERTKAEPGITAPPGSQSLESTRVDS